MNMISKGAVVGSSVIRKSVAAHVVLLSSTSIDEDAVPTDVVGALSATFGTGPYTYAILADPDSKFAVSGSNLVVRTGASFNYEVTTSHSVTIRATDSLAETSDRTFAIAVNDVADGPTTTGASSTLAAELAGLTVDTLQTFDLRTVVVSPTSQTLTFAVNFGAVDVDGFTFIWTPDWDDYLTYGEGNVDFILTATDEDGQVLTVELEGLSIIPTNEAPQYSNTTLTFDVGEGAAPAVSSTVPVDNATDVATTTNIVVTFDRDIKFGTNKAITLYDVTDAAAQEAFDTTTDEGTGNGTVSISGAVLTINPTAALDNSHEYAVQWEAGAVLNLGNEPVAVLNDTTTISFTTAAGADVTAPTISSTSPTDNATDVAITANITITFDEDVQFGTGNITLRENNAGWANLEVFDVTTDIGGGAGTVSISGNVLTIEPTADFTNSREYAIRIDATAIDDLASNSFAGIADDTTISFTTVASAGASPAFIGTAATGQTGSNTTTHNINMPTGIQVGEILLVAFSVDSNPTISIDTATSGVNWNRLGQFGGGSIGQNYDFFWKVAEGSDALRLTTSASEQSGHACQRIANATNIEFGATAEANDVNADPPSITPSAGNREYLFVALMGAEVGDGPTAAPTNYSGLVAVNGSGTSGSVGMAYRLLTAASEDPGPFTNTTGRWGAVTAAIW